MDLVEEIKKSAVEHLPNDQFIVEVKVSAGKGPKKNNNSNRRRQWSWD
jgi:hypothetical protein